MQRFCAAAPSSACSGAAGELCGGNKQRRLAYYPTASTLVLMVLASLTCLQGCRWLAARGGYDGSDLKQDEAGVHFALTPAEVGSAFGGRRNFKQRILEAQLRDKDQEVAFLRRQLDSALATSRIKDDSIKAAEELIASLRERGEAEKVARSKAQLALSERVSTLHQCQHARQTLLAEVDRCGQNLNAVMDAHEAHLF